MTINVLALARDLRAELDRTGLTVEGYYVRVLAPRMDPPKSAYAPKRCQVVAKYTSGQQCSRDAIAEGKCFQHMKMHYAKVRRAT